MLFPCQAEGETGKIPRKHSQRPGRLYAVEYTENVAPSGAFRDLFAGGLEHELHARGPSKTSLLHADAGVSANAGSSASDINATSAGYSVSYSPDSRHPPEEAKDA